MFDKKATAPSDKFPGSRRGLVTNKSLEVINDRLDKLNGIDKGTLGKMYKAIGKSYSGIDPQILLTRFSKPKRDLLSTT